MKPQHPRFTTIFHLGRTNTFRAASSALFEHKPFFGGFGGNEQNWSSNQKSIAIPDDGYKFAKVDQSGAEALIVAYLCRPGKYRDLFIHGISPHSYVALHMFKEVWKRKASTIDIEGLCACAPKDLTKHPHWLEAAGLIKSSDGWTSAERYYFLAKQTSHSSNYGIRAPTFMMNVLDKSDGKVSLSRKDAEFFLTFYRSTFPEIPAWNVDIAETVSKTKTLFNLFGHRRLFIEEDGYDLYKEAYAFIPQSTVGEITHRAFRDLQNYIEKYNKDWHLLNNEHDSYLIEFPDNRNEEIEACRIMKSLIEQDLQAPDGTKFKMRSDAYTGFTWKDMLKFKQ